jgi:hypothetical protein
MSACRLATLTTLMIVMRIPAHLLGDGVQGLAKVNVVLVESERHRKHTIVTTEPIRCNRAAFLAAELISLTAPRKGYGCLFSVGSGRSGFNNKRQRNGARLLGVHSLGYIMQIPDFHGNKG